MTYEHIQYRLKGVLGALNHSDTRLAIWGLNNIIADLDLAIADDKALDADLASVRESDGEGSEEQ